MAIGKFVASRNRLAPWQFAAVFNGGLEGLVHTVLGPRLRQRFEFNITWLTSADTEMILNSLHFIEAQK